MSRNSVTARSRLTQPSDASMEPARDEPEQPGGPVGTGLGVGASMEPARDEPEQHTPYPMSPPADTASMEPARDEPEQRSARWSRPAPRSCLNGAGSR